MSISGSFRLDMWPRGRLNTKASDEALAVERAWQVRFREKCRQLDGRSKIRVQAADDNIARIDAEIRRRRSAALSPAHREAKRSGGQS